MTRMIKDMLEKGNSDNAANIIDGADEADDNLVSLTYGGCLSDKDIYMRIAQNLELIELYY